MDARTLARLHVLGRIVLGGALTFAPGRIAQAWIGPAGARPGSRVLASAIGARDLAIGLGAASALGAGSDARPWLRAGALADAADLVATLRARSALPPLAVAGVSVVAAGSALLGLWLQREVDQFVP
jgi:hypothetical protein